MRRPVLIAFATGMALMALLAAAPGDRQQDASSLHARLLPALQTHKAPVIAAPVARPLTLSPRAGRPEARPDRWSIGRDRTDRPSRDTLQLTGSNHADPAATQD